jgi:flagellar protein FlgJ
MTTPVDAAGFYADFRGLAELRRGAQANDPQALREAARQFESVFAKMLLSSMRAASFGDPMSSDQQEFYQGLFDDQLSIELTKGRGLGLAELLVQQLTRSGLVSAEPAPAAEPKTTWQPQSPQDFVREIWPAAEEAGRELGIDPRNLVAQAALETGWGRAVPCDAQGRCSFNLFGIKAGEHWNGPAVSVRTLEFENDLPVSRIDRFRVYDSPAASFRDYVALLRNNPRYAEALNTGSDTEAFATALQRGGYATDPAYATKVTAIAQKVDSALQSFKSAAARPMTNSTDMI